MTSKEGVLLSQITADQRKTFNYYRRTYVRDSYRCIYCGRDMLSSLDDWLSLEVDHLEPSSKKGKDEDDNRVTSCNVCNRLKSSYKPDKDFPSEFNGRLKVMRKYVLEKRAVEQIRWLKALQQYDDFQKTGVLKDDSNIDRSDCTKPKNM